MPAPVVRTLPELATEMEQVNKLLDQQKDVYFINFAGTQYDNFHEYELTVSAEVLGLEIEIVRPYIQPFCFFVSDLSMQQLNALCCSLSQMKLFGKLALYGQSYVEITPNVRGVVDSFLAHHKIRSFALQANYMNETVTTSGKIQQLNYIQEQTKFQKVDADLKDPDAFFILLRDVGTEPVRFVFGVSLAYHHTSRKELQQYSLTKRKFLGPTSMDNELAVIMCEYAKAGPGSLVLDPFCGTCSILVTAASRGCICCGADFDIKIIRGKQFTYVDNFAQYGLPYPDLIWQDIHQPGYYGQEVFDCIICDPPYNLRASTRQLDPSYQNHFTEAAHQTTMGIYLETVEYAAKLLKISGRLVFWLPVPIEGFSIDDLPNNDCLKYVCSPIQHLSTKYGRRLVVLEKKQTYSSKTVYTKDDVCFNNLRDKLGYRPIGENWQSDIHV